MSPTLQKPFLRLKSRKEALYKQLHDLSTEQLQWQPASNQWSIAQVLHHLNFSERTSLAYCKKKILAGEDLPDRSFVRTMRIHAYYLILKSKYKIKAPAVVEAPGNEFDLAALHAEAQQNSADLEDFINSYPDRFLKKAIYRHPLAGRITLPQMIRFLDTHVIHHRHQINDRLSRLPSSF
ncbi:DinB family protein [Marinoscillum furvescens]|uniref:DinB family protein n=1 Tax=Marinoscillum furvescens DSM 4134 TaxID=1122208 RepID=A0A3D9L2U3_MARFU|nr:DinB family protein [Marinoscillum furvescens]RED99436.1 DinB family protein [Marinoscillum furvescens DSM 4134]